MSSTVSSPSRSAPVCVTGMGVLTAAGQNIAAFDASLRATQAGITVSHAYPSLSFPLIWSGLAWQLPIENNDKEAKTKGKDKDKHVLCPLPTLNLQTPAYGWLASDFLSRTLRRAPATLHAAAHVALEAWEHARLYDGEVLSERIGLIIAGANTSMHQGYQQSLKHQTTLSYVSPGYALNFMDTAHVGILSELLGIRGEGFTVGGASASGNVALLQGLRMLQSGAADVCVVIGALADLSPLELQAFRNLGALGGHGYEAMPDKACRPFDTGRNGFIYGQGAGCLVLETAVSAKKRQAPCLGYLLGASQVLDANHLSNPSVEGEVRAMQRALQQAKLNPSGVHYINTHGTASALGDETELMACQQLLGTHISDCWLNSTKALTGHCLWSAGIIEAISTLLQLNGHYLHGNPTLDKPIGDARFVGKQSVASDATIALSNSFGFGGINSSIVLQQGAV